MWLYVCVYSIYLQVYDYNSRLHTWELISLQQLLLNTMFLTQQRQSTASVCACVCKRIQICVCVTCVKFVDTKLQLNMCVFVTLRIIGYLCVCVAVRLKEINKCYDRKMKALLWVTTEHRGRVVTHTYTLRRTRALYPVACLWCWFIEYKKEAFHKSYRHTQTHTHQEYTQQWILMHRLDSRNMPSD